MGAKRGFADVAANWVWTRALDPVTLWPMSDHQLPSPGEFGAAFVAFMRAMQEAADAPEPPWVASLREHLGTEPAELPVTAANFRRPTARTCSSRLTRCCPSES